VIAEGVTFIPDCVKNLACVEGCRGWVWGGGDIRCVTSIPSFVKISLNMGHTDSMVFS